MTKVCPFRISQEGRKEEKEGGRDEGKEEGEGGVVLRPKWKSFSLSLLNKTPVERASFHLPSSQKSFYDANYDPLHEDCRDKFKSLSTSETSASSEITFSESMVVVTASGKVLKKRRLSLNQFITNDDLEAIASDTEEGKGSSTNNSLFILTQWAQQSTGGNET